MNNNIITQGKSILQYLPQRAPFVMVDTLYEQGDNFVVTGLTITAANIMVDSSSFKEGGLIENMAQTAAIFAGIKFKKLKKDITLGYIAAIKDVVIAKKPSINSKIYTRATVTNELLNILLVKGEVLDESKQKIASCELKIFIKK